NIVHDKARNPRVLLNLLTYLPEVCDDFERKKLVDQLNRLIKELETLFPEILQQEAADRPAESEGPADEGDALFDAAIDFVRRTKDLRIKFEPLRTGEELTPDDVIAINNKLSESVSELAGLLQAYPMSSKSSISVRRFLRSLSRIEEEIFKC